MTPGEKAVALVQAFIDEGFLPAAARIAALVALRDTIWGYLSQQPKEVQEYWEEVKQEIENL
jgi:hypothetical protein